MERGLKEERKVRRGEKQGRDSILTRREMGRTGEIRRNGGRKQFQVLVSKWIQMCTCIFFFTPVIWRALFSGFHQH
jgi:hypothetical protein